jgi:uroporphyrinogen-III synthase
VAEPVKIVLTRERGKNGSLRAWLPEVAIVDEVALTTTTYFDVDDVRVALEASSAYGTYRSLVVTSERSADYIEIALRASSLDVELFAVGAITESALAARGVRVDDRGDGPAESLAPRTKSGPVVLLGAKQMRQELAAALRANGLELTMIACYETCAVTLNADDEATLRHADVLLVGAPSAWAVARDHVARKAWVVVPGASTAAAVRLDHPRVIEGWGPQLRTQLGELSS